jgi:hypothetical protein
MAACLSYQRQLGNKIIHPFSDLLSHDIGTGDGIVQVGPQDTANKLRTCAPVGLAGCVDYLLAHAVKGWTLDLLRTSGRRRIAAPCILTPHLTRVYKNQEVIITELIALRSAR